jgi:hypothetical protein
MFCSIWLGEQEQQAAAVAAAAEALEGLDLDTLDLLSNASKQVWLQATVGAVQKVLAVLGRCMVRPELMQRRSQ